MRLPPEVRPVAIVGGGFLGSALACALPGPTFVATRSGRWRGGVAPDHVHVGSLDVTTDPIDRNALGDARSLVIAVASGGGQDRRSLYVEGTRRLLAATDQNRWRRVVYIGSTSALPDLDGWVDENTNDPPNSERGRVQRDAEHVVAEHCTAVGIPYLVLRLGGLYGPGRPIGMIYGRRDPGGASGRRREGPMPGDGHVPTNLIHRDDAVAAVLHALAAPPTVTGIVHVVDDDHTPRRAMYAQVAQRGGYDPIQWERDAAAGQPPRGKRVGNLRLKTTLGVRLLHPTHDIASA